MTYQDFFDQTNLEKSLLIGYYGGGNFGDELLLEVLLNVLYQRHVTQASFVYRNLAKLHAWHATFPYQPVASMPQLLGALVKSRTIIVGGGGLWGMDVNRNIFILSVLLLTAKICLRKKIYLLGVGYYGSTGRLGRLSAYLAAKSAQAIIARDSETYHRFTALSADVSQDHDLAFLLQKLDLSAYNKAAQALANSLQLGDHMVYVTIRQFHDDRAEAYHQAIEATIAKNPNIQWVVSLLQPAVEYPAGQKLLMHWQQQYNNVQVLNTDCNPMALVRFFQKQFNRFKFITPQFHAIITAMICDIPYLPLVYDNKVQELLSSQAVPLTYKLEQVSAKILDEFVNKKA